MGVYLLLIRIAVRFIDGTKILTHIASDDSVPVDELQLTNMDVLVFQGNSAHDVGIVHDTVDSYA